MAVKRRYVIPGDLVAKGNYQAVANVFKVGDHLYSTRVGMAEIADGKVRVIPLSGTYIPKVDDFVIGKIVDYSAFGWEVDINSCFYAFLPAQSVFGKNFSSSQDSLPKKFSIGDLISAKVVAFDRTRNPVLSITGPGLGKVPKGEIVRIAAIKVPRLIGRRGSMSRIIEASTGCRLGIGQNGIIVVTGPPEGVIKAVKAIKLIEEEAHTANLTEKVRGLLEGNKS